MGRGLGVHASQGWAKTNHKKGVGFFKVPKSGVGRVWRRFKAHDGKRNLPYEMGLPRWE